MIKLIIFLHFLNPTPERVYNECVLQNVLHPEIVTKQFILETGNGTSRACLEYKNLFGLTGKNGLYKFDHWKESITAYKDWVQYKYKSGDYYNFLDSIGYAEAKNYTKVLRTISLKFKN